MPRPQLAINCPAPLLERLKAAAAAQGTTVTSLVLAWVEAGLDQRLDPSRSDLDPSRPASRPDLDQRLDAVERRLDALEAPAPAKPASPSRVSLPAQPGEPLPLPERRLTAAEAAALLTTPELAKALGLRSDSALTNWIAREAKKNGSAVGSIYRRHRLRGMGLLPGGQRPGWLWEPAV